MTDHEMSQLRRNLMSQFNQMMAEDVLTLPDDYAHLYQPEDWDFGF